MRKKLFLALVFITILFTLPGLGLGAQEVQIMVNGYELPVDVPPMIEKGRVLVPMRGISVPIRFISEALGAEVIWKQDIQTVVINTETEPIEYPILIKSDDISQIDFSRMGELYSALYSDYEEDTEKIKQLVALYNQAAGNLGERSSLYHNTSSAFALQYHFILNNGKVFTMLFNDIEGTCIRAGDSGIAFKVKDPKLSKEIKEKSEKYFVGERLQINPTELRMGEQITIRQDHVETDKVHIFLRPSRDGVTIPSAPQPYPTQDSILIATIPVENNRFKYSFILTPEIGKLYDGSGGKIGPGQWSLMYAGGYLSGHNLTILPSDMPEQKAVIYDRGRIYTWSQGQGVKTEILKDPKQAPFIIGESQWGGSPLDVSLKFVNDWLDIDVTEVEQGKYRLGPAKLGLTVKEGDKKAWVNGTMIQLDASPLRKIEDTIRLSWPRLGFFFGYRCQQLGPEQVAFLQNMDEIPQEIQQILKKDEMAYKPGKKVVVGLEGKPIDLGDKQAFVDNATGRIIVPLRETARALGAELQGFQLNRDKELDELMAEHNYGLIDIGPKVKSYLNILLGRKQWRVYLTPETEQNTMISIDELAFALGYKPIWDAENSRLNLIKMQ